MLDVYTFKLEFVYLLSHYIHLQIGFECSLWEKLHSNCSLLWNSFGVKTAFQPQPFIECIWPEYCIPTAGFYEIHLPWKLHSDHSLLWNTSGPNTSFQLHPFIEYIWPKYYIPTEAFYEIHFSANCNPTSTFYGIHFHAFAWNFAFHSEPFMEYISLHWPGNCIPTTAFW